MRELGDRIVTGRAAYVVVGIVFAAVFVGAVLMIWLGPSELKQAGGQTLTASLIGFLTTFLLDVNAKERERVDKLREAERAKLTLQLEQAFTFGSSSHMAEVAFDRHVTFCDAYAEALWETFETLLRDGVTAKAADHATKLWKIRRSQTHWLTAEMDEPLEKFEQALRTLASDERRIERGVVDPGKRSVLIDRAEVLFDRITGIAPKDSKRDEIEIGALIRSLGQHLGVCDLMSLRLKVLKRTSAPHVEL